MKEAPLPTDDEPLSLEELKLLVIENISAHQAQIDMLQGLVDKAEWGLDHNFRVDIFLSGDDGMVHVELEKKPPIGFRTQ